MPIKEDISVNAAFNEVFSLSPRILIAFVISFLIEEYVNSVILAKSKVYFQGKLFSFRANR